MEWSVPRPEISKSKFNEVGLSHLGPGIKALIGVECLELAAYCRVLLQCIQHPASFFLSTARPCLSRSIALQEGLETRQPRVQLGSSHENDSMS